MAVSADLPLNVKSVSVGFALLRFLMQTRLW